MDVREQHYVDPELPSIPGYAVEAVLGSGGMATVYRGRQLALDRPVAIKVLRAFGRDSEELQHRFEQEAKLIAALDHPHIVAIYEVTRSAAGEACYVMPYFSHGDLASRPRPMPEAEIKRVLTAVLDALGHAHAAGVVHRDVKPENVLFDARGKPLLADFGVALRVQRSERLTSHGRTVGSSLQMSPEQARGEIVDGRSDLYSVGCLAFELLTGRPPFDGDDFLVVALLHQQEPVPRLPAQYAHWQDWIDRALAKSPKDRFADAAQMATALQAITAKPRTGPRRGLAWKRQLAVAGAVLLVVLAVMAASSMLRSDERGADDIAAATSEDWEGIAMAIAEGRWFGESSAAAALLPQLLSDPVPEPALELRDALLMAFANALDTLELAPLLEQGAGYKDFVAAAKLGDSPHLRTITAGIEVRLLPIIEQARERRDRAEADPVLSLALQLPAASPAFTDAATLVASFPARGEPFRDGDGPELLLIPGGRLSGYTRPFAVTRFEITRGDYARFVAASGRKASTCVEGGSRLNWDNPGYAQQANEPVVCVSFHDAQAYAAWLSQRTGRNYRLPSLAEWRSLELAARAGTCANLRGENAPCGDSFRNTAPVGRFASSEGMPQDLAGNVREWTSSCEFKEISAVRRGFANFGRLLQGKERDRSGRVCVGRYVAGSGFRDASADRAADSVDEDSAAPDRGFRLIREIR